MNLENLKILIIEDDPFFRKHLIQKISPYGPILEAENFQNAQNLLSAHCFDVVVIDLNLGGETHGLELLKIAKKKNFFSIVLTDFQSRKYIKLAYELGCDHYLTKNQFERVIDFIFKDRLQKLHGEEEFSQFFHHEFVTADQNLISEIKSLKMRLLKARPILILGETGVGKGVLANFIHRMRFSTSQPFVALNASAINENLMETELFGHKKGAFTGAYENKIGKLELANGGTLFLDEIASIPLGLQVKLLKAIEEKCFYPLGASKPVQIDFQLITATCEDIYKKIQKETFRLDLFHRINAITLTIRPLRERQDDIKLLIDYFLNLHPRKVYISDEAMEILIAYSWPGNVRELKSIIDNLIDHSEGLISVEQLPSFLKDDWYQKKDKENVGGNGNLLLEDQFKMIKKLGINSFLEKLQEEALQMALREERGVALKATKLIGLPLTTFYRYQKKYEMLSKGER